MSKEYDQISAIHYSAFRPSLHSKILNTYFAEIPRVQFGLDVGCGTGHSSIALATFCDKVIGIDPSKEMLQRSLTHPNVEYALCDDKKLDFANDHFNIITFAGSLYYAKSQQLLNETIRVSKHTAKILVYDFQIFLDEILNTLALDDFSKQQSDYDHQVNFSGLDEKNIKIEKEFSKSYSIKISLSNLAHLLLSSKDNYNILSEIYGEDDLYNKVLQKIQTVMSTEKILVEAMTYLTVYTVIK